MCPNCRQNAPIVYRGAAAYCTACGAPRLPLSSESVTLAGTGSKLGGTVARVIGWIVLAVGLSVAFLVGGILQWAMEGGILGLAIASPIALFSVVIGYLLLRSGKSLQDSGASEAKSARHKALYSLAQSKRGSVTVLDAAQSLGISMAEADALLTELAKTRSEDVSLEIDDAGGIYYRFPRFTPGWQPQRVDASSRVPSPSAAAQAEAEAEAVAAEDQAAARLRR